MQSRWRSRATIPRGTPLAWPRREAVCCKRMLFIDLRPSPSAARWGQIWPRRWPPRAPRGLILRHIFFGFHRAELLKDLIGPLEHHLQLAADGEELPALFDAQVDFFGGAAVKAGGDLVLLAGLEDAFEGLVAGFGAGALAVLAAHA